jgi:hypothetical protein
MHLRTPKDDEDVKIDFTGKDDWNYCYRLGRRPLESGRTKRFLEEMVQVPLTGWTVEGRRRYHGGAWKESGVQLNSCQLK